MTPEERRRRLYTVAAEKLGMDYQQVDEVIADEFGGQPQSFTKQYNALKRFTVARGGMLPSDPEQISMWTLQHGPVALHSAYPQSTPLEPFQAAEEGQLGYGGRQYPIGVLDLSLGYGANKQGEYEFGIDDPAKLTKRWRSSGMQQGGGWFRDLEVREASTLARKGTVPEQIQPIKAWVAMTEFAPEGHAWLDPKIGPVQTTTMARIPIPRNVPSSMVDLSLGQILEAESEPLVFFPGHKGMKPDRQYQSSEVVMSGIFTDDTATRHGEQAADRWLVVQKRNLMAEGTTVQIKDFVKGGGSPMAGLQDKYGVQAVLGMRDPLSLAASNVAAMTPETQVQHFGREIPRWTDDLYGEWYEKVGKPSSGVRTVTGQVYSMRDPNTQLMINQKTLTNVKQLGNDMVQADISFYAMELDFALRPVIPYRGKGAGIGVEDLAAFKDPAVVANMMRMSQKGLRSTQDMAAAYMANTQTTSYQAEPISSFDWGTATAASIVSAEALPGGMSAVEKGVFNEFMFDQLATSKGFQGKGVAFPQPFGRPDMIMPNPNSMRQAGGDAAVIGRGYGAFRDYNTLLGDTAKWNKGTITDEEYAKTSDRAMESFTKAVSAQGFRKILTGAPMGSSDIGMRFSANPGLPENRYFMNSDLLAGFIKDSVPSDVDPKVWAKAMVRGDMGGPQANYMRHPFVNAEEQADTIVGWWSYKDQLTLTPNMSLVEFEQIGASVNVSPILEQASNGDDDGDSQKVTAGTMWSPRGIARHIGNMVSRLKVIQRAKDAPGDEQGSTAKKLRAGVLSVDNMEVIDLRMAEAVTGYAASDVLDAFATSVEAKSGIARAHKPFIRDIPHRIRGDDPLSESTRNVLRKPYMTVQDMGFLEGIEKEIVDLYHGLRGNTMSGIKTRGAEGERNEFWRFGGSSSQFQISLAGKIAGWDKLSPEQAAVALGGESSGAKYEGLLGDVQTFRSATKSLARSSAIGSMVHRVGSLEEHSRSQPIIGAIYERAMSSVSEKVGVMADPNDPLSVWTATQGQVSGIDRGETVRNYLDTYKKHDRGEIKPELWTNTVLEALQDGYVTGREAQHYSSVLKQMGVDPTSAPAAGPSDPGTQGPTPYSQADADKAWEAMTNQAAAGAGGAGSGSGGPGAPTSAVPASPIPPTGPSSRHTAHYRPSAPAPAAGLSQNQTAVSQMMQKATGAMLHNIGGGETPMSGYASIKYTPSGGTTVHSNIRSMEEALTERMTSIVKALDEWQPLIEDVKGSQGQYNDQIRKIIPLLGDYKKQLSQATGIQAQVVANEAATGAGATQQSLALQSQVSTAYDVLNKSGIDFPQLEQDVKLQNELAQISAMGDGGRTAFQNVKKALFGWAPMQMGRAWNMMGAPTFKKYIPAAGQEQLAAYGLSQQIGGEAAGPGGMAGGLLAYQAQMAANQAQAGRAGYRAWGTGIGAEISGVMQSAQAVAGPGIGAGLGTGILLNALGDMDVFGVEAQRMAGPVGLAVTTIGAGLGVRQNIRSYGTGGAANAYAQEGDGGFWREVAGDYRTYMGAAEFARPGSGFQAVREGQQLVQDLHTTPIQDMTPGDRTVALNSVANRLREGGGYYGNLAPDAILEQMSRGADYDRQLSTWTDEKIVAAGGTDIMKLAQRGVYVDQYEDLAGAMMMGSAGPAMLARGAPTQPQDRRAYDSTLAQYSGLAQFGVSGAFIQEQVSSGAWSRMGQADELNMGRVLGGQATQGQALQLADTLGYAPIGEMFTRQDNGMPLGTQNLQGLGLGARPPSGYSMTQRMQGAPGPETAPGGFATAAAWGGTWGIEDALSTENWEYSQAQQGLQFAALGQRRSFMEGSWGLQDRGTALSRAQVVGGQGYQGSQSFALQQNQMQDRNFGTNWDLTYKMFQTRTGFEQESAARGIEDMTRGYGRSLMQRAWTQDAWAFDQQTQSQMRGWQDVDFTQGQATNQREFGWRMEDYDMNIRFATGRDRTRLETGRERDVIRQNEVTRDMGEDRDRQEQQREWADQMQSTIEEHQQQKWGWEDEDHARNLERSDEAKERNLELIALQDEQYQNQKTQNAEMVMLRNAQFEESKLAYEEGYQLQTEVTDLQRDNQEKTLANAEAAAGIAADHATTIHALNEDYRLLGRSMSLRQTELNMMIRELMGPEMMKFFMDLQRAAQAKAFREADALLGNK